MNPLSAALIAKQSYKDTPTYGVESQSGRAVMYPGGVIAFPGTNNIACLLADLNIDIIDTHTLGKLHKGFWDAFSEVWPSLMRLSPTTIIGHSEGGAIALIYAASLIVSGRPPKEVYAFEAPQHTTDSVMREIFRVSGINPFISHNGHDIVPCVPHLIEGWQQSWKVTEIKTTTSPYPQISDDPLSSITDHFIDSVINSLKIGGLV